MNLCDLTFDSPEENLACDEALLDACEAGAGEGALRFWEPQRYFVVVGYGNEVGREVNQSFCRQEGIPILRRCSGGGTVLQGPGILNYGLVLRVEHSPSLAGISGTNDFVMGRHQRALQALLGRPVERQGCTDLALQGRKFCGNSQRRRKNSVLFHGSFLLETDLELMERVLPLPSRQPEYRSNRSHGDFLMNLRIPFSRVKTALAEAWDALHPLKDIPSEQIIRLAAQRYTSDDWNFRF